jgi:hypothetical protein
MNPHADRYTVTLAPRQRRAKALAASVVALFAVAAAAHWVFPGVHARVHGPAPAPAALATASAPVVAGSALFDVGMDHSVVNRAPDSDYANAGASIGALAP